MALDFPSTSRDSNRNATKDIVHGRNGETATIREEGDEECARTLLEFPGRGRHSPLERQNILGVQCGECLLRNEQLRRAHGDFLGCRQVIYEFGPDATIFFQGAKGPKQAQITELLLEGFRLE